MCLSHKFENNKVLGYKIFSYEYSHKAKKSKIRSLVRNTTKLYSLGVNYKSQIFNVNACTFTYPSGFHFLLSLQDLFNYENDLKYMLKISRSAVIALCEFTNPFFGLERSQFIAGVAPNMKILSYYHYKDSKTGILCKKDNQIISDQNLSNTISADISNINYRLSNL